MRLATTSALLVLLMANPAWAEGNLGVLYKPLNPEVLGLEAELRPTTAPWSVGFLYQARRREISTGSPELGHLWVNPASSTVWVRQPLDTPFGVPLEWLAGVNYYSESASVDLPPHSWLYLRPVIGASYTLRSGRIWLRVTPHLVPSLNERYQDATWLTRSGIPWFEAGIQLLPGLQISFRLAEAFAKLAWTFD